MAKKKSSRKASAKSPKSKAPAKVPAKASAKKTKKRPSQAKKEPRGPDGGRLDLWKQIPGTFTYTSRDRIYDFKIVCKAKRAMSQFELDESWVVTRIFHPFREERGTTVECDAIENATQVLRDIIRKPTPEFIAKIRAFFASYIPERTGLNAFVPQPFACPQCHGKGWVCEDHIFVPWEVKCRHECPCGAPEMACRTCNPTSAFILGPGDFSIGRLECSLCENQRWLCAKHKKPWKLANIGCDCRPGTPCPECNPDGHIELGHCKIIHTGFN